MTDNISLFPQPLPGWTFSVIRAPKFAQRKTRTISGRTLRTLDQLYPVYEWTLTYDVLREKNDSRIIPATIGNFIELRKLMGHYVAMNGSFGPFLFYDPTDGQSVQYGFGDGVSTVYPLARGLVDGGLIEPVHAAIIDNDTALTALTGLSSTSFTVTLDGTPTTAFTKQNWWSNHTKAIYQITFTSPPGNGVLIAITMTYLWPVTFMMDSQEFENFLINRWGVRQLKLESFLVP